MIIRSFLFLLAMLTGVSAAHAAGNVQLSPSSIGATALTNAAQGGPSVSDGQVYSSLHQPYTAAPHTLSSLKQGYFPAEQFVIRAPCTLRSDRTRE